MIKLSIGLLEHQNVELVGEDPAAILDLGPESIYQAVAPLHYELQAKLITGGVLVSGIVSIRLRGECGRCLEAVECEVVNDDVCLFLTPGDAAELDITEDVRNEMLIELPINLLCRDDCRGLCPKCGVNLNEVACGCRPEGGAEASPRSALDAMSP